MRVYRRTPNPAGRSSDVIDTLISSLVKSGARQATKYVSPTQTIKATRRHKPNKRDLRVEFVLTIGRPNYKERAFIKTAKKAGEPFPIKKVQLKHYPYK